MLHVNCNSASVIGGKKFLGEVKSNRTRLDLGLSCILPTLKLNGTLYTSKDPEVSHCEGILLSLSLMTLILKIAFQCNKMLILFS